MPDIDGLRASPVRTVVGAGAASGDQPAGRAAAALAEGLATEVVEFPGDHGGIMTAPDEYAAKLDGLLRR